jgi:hypothetical protein
VYVINWGGATGTGTVDPLVAAARDTTWSSTNGLVFNGNDAVSLYNALGDTLDIIGILCNNPAVGWPVGSGSANTANITLVRKQNVHHGEKNWTISTNQWDIYNTGDYTHLGSHTMTPCGAKPTVAFSSSADTIIESAGKINIPVKIINPDSDTTKVTVAIIGGTANAADYIYNIQTLVFLPDSTTPLIDTVRIIDDGLIEFPETISFKLINAILLYTVLIVPLHLP